MPGRPWPRTRCRCRGGHGRARRARGRRGRTRKASITSVALSLRATRIARDRKSTRLNSSHANISYAVFCLKKNNAGAYSLGLPEEVAADSWDTVHDTNLRAAWLMARAAYPYLSANGGSILNDSSVGPLAGM